MVNKEKMKSSKSGTVKKFDLERFKPKNWFNRSQASSPVPSTPGGEDRDADVALVQSVVSSPGLQMIIPILGPSQAQLLTSQSSYPISGPSDSTQTYDHQGSASSIGPTDPHSKGTVVDPPQTSANPEISTRDARSTSQSLAGVAWNFTAMLLKRLPDAIDTNPVRIASNIIRIVLEINDTVRGNIDAVEKRILSTVDQLRALEEVRDGWTPNGDKEMRAVELFESTLIKEYANLIKLKEQSLIRKIADHEEDKGEIAEIFQRINQAREQLVVVTGLIVHQIALEIREDVARLLLERLEAAHSADHKYEPEGEDQQSLRRTVCTPGTRVRILGDITRWANDTSSESQSIYWLVGQGGSGKTTIAHTIARRFEFAQDADDTIILGGNFFCSRHFKETRSATRIVRTIAYHLALRCKPFADSLDHKSFDAVHQNARTQLQCLLVDPWKRVQSAELSKVPRFLVIIDALDEIDGEGGSEFLRDLLDSIDKHRLRGLKFFATSRPDQNLVKHLQSCQDKKFYHLRQVPVEEADADIIAYLNAELPRFRNTPEIKKLVEQAAGLFIYAATVVRYSSKLKYSHSEQKGLISRLIKSGIPQSTKETPLLNKLYQQVLSDTIGQFMDDNDEDENINFKHRLKILHTFLCSAEPISINVVANLISPSEPEFIETVAHVLASLHAVLYSENDKVFSYHKSFTDFIFNENRAQEFWCNPPQFHLLLSRNCFDIMNSELRFNIANIQSSFLLDHDNAALPDAIKQNISSVLIYTCHNWVYHLSLADSNQLADTLTNFLKLPVLFWIEAMNLMGSRGLCEYMLRGARKVVMNNTPLEVEFAEAASFALYFSGSAASLSTPHLYISSLATWHMTSGLSRGWKTHFPRIPKFVHSAGGAALMTITTASPVNTIALSSNGKYLVSGLDDGTVRVWDASTGEELKVLEGHCGTVFSVAFSSDNKRIVSGSADRTVRVWDASTGEELKVLQGHGNYVRSVAFSSDNKQIVSGSDDKTVRVWDASTGEELKVLEGHGDYVRSVAFSSDNMWIVSGSDDKMVRVWDALTGEELKVLEGHHGPVFSVAFSSDIKRIVSGSDDKTVQVWDALTGEELKMLGGHGRPVWSVSFSSDNKQIVSGSSDETVRVWDALTGEELNVLEGHGDYVRSVAFSSDNKRIVSGSSDKTVWVWDVLTGEELKVLEGHGGYVQSVAFSSNNKWIVSGSSDETVRVWDALTGEELKVLEGHCGYVQSVAFSSDNKWIVSGSDDKTVRVWDALTGEELKVLAGHCGRVQSVAFSSDNKWIVSGSDNKTVRMWDVLTGEELKVLEGHGDYVRSVAFSSDNKRIVSGSDDKTVRVWDASTGEELKVLEGHGNDVFSVAFSSDNKWIVSGSDDETVRVWDALTGEELKVLEGHRGRVQSVTFSSDIKQIVSGSDNKTVRMWDALTGEELKVLQGHGRSVWSVAFSSDNKRIVSGSGDKTVQVWDALTGEQLKVLEGHGDYVRSVAFSIDNKRIVSGSDDKTVRVWDASMGEDSELKVLEDNDNYHKSLHYSRQKDEYQRYTGWLLSPLTNHFLMFVPTDAKMPNSFNILTMPQSAAASVDFTFSTLGPNWSNCFSLEASVLSP